MLLLAHGIARLCEEASMSTAEEVESDPVAEALIIVNMYVEGQYE